MTGEIVDIAQGALQRGVRGGVRIAREQLERGGAHHRGLPRIVHEALQAARGAGQAAPARMQRRPDARPRAPGRAVPTVERGGGPRRTLARMAAAAGVRRADRGRQVGSRHLEPVVAPRIVDHVGGGGHVAVDAARTGLAGLVPVVLDDVVARGRVALRAGGVAGQPHLLGVRIVAVAAGDARLVHLALAERAPDEHLVLLLAVGVVEALAQRDRQEMVEQPVAGAPTLGELAAPRVAARAGLHLVVGGARLAAPRVAGGGILRPSDATALVEGDREAVRAIPALAAAHRRDVRRARPVAGLAADRDLRVAGVVAARRVVVALADIGGVAVGAHEVPVLRALRPVQLVTVVELLRGILPEPALAARLGGTRVPGDGHGLQPTARQFDEILLLRLDPEGVLHLEIGELAVGSVGADEELAVALEERGGDAVAAVGRAAEIAEDGVGGGVLHGAGVLRAPPGRALGLVAGRAGGAADERRAARRRVGCSDLRRTTLARSTGTRVSAPPPERGGEREQGDAGKTGVVGQLAASSGGVSVLGRDRWPSSRLSC